MAAVNWTREETFKLISVWSEDAIQQQPEGCRRNSQVYQKIADELCEAGFSRTLEQCRDKIKKLRAEYKRIEDKRDTTGEGRYPEWEFFDALGVILAPKHSTEPPIVVESFRDSPSVLNIGPDDDTQEKERLMGPLVQFPVRHLEVALLIILLVLTHHHAVLEKKTKKRKLGKERLQMSC